ncbi:MAG: hypothetical protein HC902_08835 [Calothrix sp. SM1_5_4]|nr:hypothetical protein [Calothrix sp. SM1_5_4]
MIDCRMGGVVSLAAGMNFTRELRADFELDILGLLEKSAQVKDGFFSAFRANDRVALGVSYVF